MLKRKGLMSVMSVQQANSKEIKRLEALLRVLFLIPKAPLLAMYYIGQFAETIHDKLDDVEREIPYRYVRATKLPLNGIRKEKS